MLLESSHSDVSELCGVPVSSAVDGVMDPEACPLLGEPLSPSSLSHAIVASGESARIDATKRWEERDRRMRC